MATSAVTACNLALSMIGTRSTIASLTEQSAEALQCNLQYGPCLDAILSAAHWNFARKQSTLALLKDRTLTPPDDVPPPWTYEYAYPSDCLHARYLTPAFPIADPNVVGVQSAPYIGGPFVRWIISTDLDTSNVNIKVILTDQPTANMVYTFRAEDPTLWDSQFLLALAALIGSRIAIPLTGDKGMAQMAFQQADAITRAARGTNGNEGVTVIDSVPDWIAVRGFTYDWATGPGCYWNRPIDLVAVF